MGKLKGNLSANWKKKPGFKRDSHELSGLGKGVIFCEKCGIVYYKKSWHHSLLNLKSIKEEAPVKFVLCPACQMIKNKQYEGRIVIKNVPEKSGVKLEELINEFCRRAYDRDPMDRLIEIKKSHSTSSGQAVWEVTTTENQLANKLAQKIKSSFSGVKTKTKFNKEPSDVVEVIADF